MNRLLSLVEALNNYLKEDIFPMHVPGHKRNKGLGRYLADFYSRRIHDYDFTELSGLDDLHECRDVLKDSQEFAAEVFEAYKTLFLINGCSVGIHSAIMGCAGEGEKVLIPRNAHRSVFEGLILSGARPVYYFPEIDYETSLPLYPNFVEIEELLEKETFSAVVIVHPTYHGVGSDFRIIDKAHEMKTPVIVDEAHGSHFKFCEHLPASTLNYKADIVVHSTHKNLGSLTQTGLIHHGNGEFNFAPVENMLSLLQSTSPSYVLMASLDAMCSDLFTLGRKMVGDAVELALYLRKEIASMPGLFLAFDGIYLKYDPTKILLQSSFMDGKKLSDKLRSKYGVYPELETPEFVLLIVTLGDTVKSVKYLIDCLKDIVNKYAGKTSEELGKKINDGSSFLHLPEIELTPREAFQHKKKVVSIFESVGEICGAVVTPYPPGIPLLCPGERITEEAYESIENLLEQGHHIQGIKEDKVEVLKID